MAQNKKRRRRRRMRKRTRNRLILAGGILVVLFILYLLIHFIVGLFSSPEPKDNTGTTPETKTSEETVVSFMGVGDNLIHETVYNDALQDDGTYDFSKMYTNFKKDAKESDIAFINQETVLGGESLGLSGYPTFNSPTEIAKNLEKAGFNLANLATNHCLDRGEQGIANELEAFSNTNIVTDGIAPDYDYNVSYLDDDQIKSDVQKAKEISDVVIVSAHWGDENTFEPNDLQKHYAQLFADCGVDVVIGTHPHTIQPVKWIKGSSGNKMLCVYSLGNFIGGMLTTDNAIGGEIKFDFVKKSDKITIENVKWIPTVIHFEGNQNNIMEVRYNYKAYKLSQYSDKLAKKHVLNGYDGNTVSIKYITNKTKEVIDEKYLK